MKVVILAGGFGTRLSEYTDSIPKPMVPIGNKPIIEHIMKFNGFANLFLCLAIFLQDLTDLRCLAVKIQQS